MRIASRASYCVVVLLLLLAGPALAFSNACLRDPGGPYCGAIGKRAYNLIGDQAARGADLGPIVGVTFREKGKLVSVLGQSVRLAARDGWYYVIGPGGISDREFLRPVQEIEPR